MLRRLVDDPTALGRVAREALRICHYDPETGEYFGDTTWTASIGGFANVGGSGESGSAQIDFSGDAARAGLTMRAERLLIFGNPKAGTPLMQAEPAVGLDLPLKALVWQDASGQTQVAYNDPQYIIRRHGLAAALAANLAAVVPLIERAASG